MVLQQLGRAPLDPAVEQGQVHLHIRIGVEHLHKYVLHPDFDPQFLPAFPPQGLFLGLPGLHLAPYKFP